MFRSFLIVLLRNVIDVYCVLIPDDQDSLARAALLESAALEGGATIGQRERGRDRGV
jgi:hypothetical protein